MVFREADEVAQGRSARELDAREKLAPLAAEGRGMAEEARPGSSALAPATRARAITIRPRQFPMLSGTDVDAALSRLSGDTRRAIERRFIAKGRRRWPVGISIASFYAVGAIATGDWLSPWSPWLQWLPLLPLVAPFIVYPMCRIAQRQIRGGGWRRFRREVSRVASLPFPVDGYLEMYVPPGPDFHITLDVTVDMPRDDLGIVDDLLARIAERDTVTTAVWRPDGLSIRTALPQDNFPRLHGWLRRFFDEVLIPFHTLHPIAHVDLRWVQAEEELGGRAPIYP